MMRCLACLFTGLLACIASAVTPAEPLKVLIITGANNHDWQSTTEVLEEIYGASDQFTYEVELNPERLTAEVLAQYDVLLSNWNTFGPNNKAAPWPPELKVAYADFVLKGGGHIALHAGSTAHYDWPEFQQIGLANWDITGGTGHGPVHEFEARIADAAHPITAGLGSFKTTDELWHKPRVEPDAHVIVEAYSNITNQWEPSVLTGQFGEGRCFTILLGHDANALRNVSFQTLLLRGTAWAGGQSAASTGSLPNAFFSFDNGIGYGKWTPQKQAATLKALGYDGIGYIGVHNFAERLKAFQDAGLTLYNLYVQVDPTKPQPYHPMVLQTLPLMEGSGVALWVPVFGKTTDEEAARVMRELADAANQYGVRVVLYPHAHFHIATTSDAVRLLKLIDRDNVGLSINLCHAIYAGNGDRLDEVIEEAAPYLEFVSVHGADRDVRTWDKLIQTLDAGDFDQAAFLKQLSAAGYTGPIGLQCHGLKGGIIENLTKSIEAWEQLSAY